MEIQGDVDPIMIIYWLKCPFEPACCKFKGDILYLWSLYKEIMENLYEDETIKADCKATEEYTDS